MRRRLATVLVMLVVLMSLVQAISLWPRPSDEQAARNRVISAYEIARSGDMSEIRLARQHWQRLNDQFGRVLTYRVTSLSRQGIFGKPWKGDYVARIRVQRQRADTVERVFVSA